MKANSDFNILFSEAPIDGIPLPHQSLDYSLSDPAAATTFGAAGVRYIIRSMG